MFETLAVVPIFVNAGTALLPAILAPLASALALLVRPRELLSLCRRRPAVPVGVLAAAVGLWYGVQWLLAAPPAVAPPRQIDWAAVARDYLALQASGNVSLSQHQGPAVYRFGYARTGHDGGPAPRNLQPVGRFIEPDAMFLSSPIQVGGRVYGATTSLNAIAGNYGIIFSLDASQHALRPLWRFEMMDGEPLKPFFSSPAITADGKYLLIGQGLHEDDDSHLICLNAETGALRWRIKTPLHIEGSPAIHEDMVVAGAGAIEVNGKPAGDGGFVLAARISDGAELWRFALADPESSPAIAPDGTIYIGSGMNGRAVFALRSETDEELRAMSLQRVIWEAPTAYPITGAITLYDGLVIAGGGNGDYVSSNPNPAGMVIAFDAATGEVRWRADLPDACLGAIAARDGKLICPVRNGEVIALDSATGQTLWRRRISGTAPILASPAIAGDYIYAVSNDGVLAVLRVADGTVLERHSLNDPANPGSLGLCISSPTIAGQSVLVGSETGGLHRFAAGKGEP